MRNERCPHSAHSPPPRQRPQARRHGQRYVKYVPSPPPRSRGASQRRLRRAVLLTPGRGGGARRSCKSETIGDFCAAVTQPGPLLCCLHLRPHRSFPPVAPDVTLFLSAFGFAGPPARARSAFSGPLPPSSPRSPPPPAGSFHLPSPLSVSPSFLFVTHPPSFCLPLPLVIYPHFPPVFCQSTGRDSLR